VLIFLIKFLLFFSVDRGFERGAFGFRGLGTVCVEDRMVDLVGTSPNCATMALRMGFVWGVGVDMGS
jgi:hypothetical protein